MRWVQAIRGSVRGKTMAVVLTTTLAALIVNALALLAYELQTYRQTRLDDLRTQAEILGRATAPALAFGDRKEALKDLSVLHARPDILAASLHGADGRLFASYEGSPGALALAQSPEALSVGHKGNLFYMSQSIFEEGNHLGEVRLVARSRLYDRIVTYLGILAGVMAVALAVALLVSAWLQRAITRPIVQIESAARAVVERQDFTVRAPRTSEDEIGVLAEAFNRMLDEVERRQGELRIADRRKDEFLATLAHELRNPLAPIRNAVTLMKLSADKPEVLAEARAMIERQVKQMVHLVDDLIDVSRITTGKLVLRRERVDAVAIARSALEAVEPLARSGGQAITTRLPDAPLYLNADATRLTQVFLNLLNNAVKFTDAGGLIEFELKAEGGQLKALVRDNGVGISAGQLESIFEMFHQADGSLERSAGGLGVGLALARRLVELHGGGIAARSKGAGRGSEFEVVIPLAGAHAEHGYSERAPGADASARPQRILVVDDNRDFAQSLAALLRGMGNEVHVAHDGAEGYAAARRIAPDISFLDIGMPKMNGFALAHRLRQSETTSGAILVAITGFSQPADRQRAKDAGFDHYFVKPIEIERLQEILTRH